MSQTSQASPTVYYDGACPVCSREIAMYQRQAGGDAVCWVDASRCDETAFAAPDGQGAGLTREAALARMHVRRADGMLVSGAAAFVALWAALPRTAWLARWLGWPPVLAVLEVGYRGFLWVRRAWRRPA